MSETAPDGRSGITVDLVRRLIAEQFPVWAGLPVRPVEHDGWDNRTYRLGDELSVRLPSAAGYVEAVAKEDRWLPRLAPQLPLPVPVPVATGRPGAGYPHPWSVRRWLPGRVVGGRPLTGGLSDSELDAVAFARDLAAFLVALRGIEAADGPAPGPHCFHRGGPPAFYGAEVGAALDTLGDAVDRRACEAVWSVATSTRWTGDPVWFHGDVAPGNLLLDGDGRLAAVLDFGTCGVGDPACDLVVAWTVLRGTARETFRAETALDDATWDRARGWVLWKTLIVWAADGPSPELAAVLAEVLADRR